MPSFSSFLQVGGRQYELTYFEFSLNQHRDGLGRPASLVQGGFYTLEMNAPGGDDNTLYEWMASPTKQLTGQVVIKQMNARINLKVVRFISAYCVELTERFDGTTTTSSFKLSIRISPEKVIMDGITHDNRWPNPTEGEGMTGEQYIGASWSAKSRDPDLFREQPSKTPPPPLAPPKPPICADVLAATQGETKQERYDARMAIVQAGQNNPALRDVADQFEKNNRAIERAKLADDIYLWDKEKLWADDPERYQERLDKLTTSHPPEGWEVIEPFVKDPDTGFAYAVYQSKFEKPPVPVLVFRGTDNADEMVKDWKTNVMQGNGMETAQYTESVQKARKLFVKYKGKLEIAGHSKAGGQAAAAGTVSGATSYTFNAAGVHENTLNRFEMTRQDAQGVGADGKPLVNAFDFPHDFLNNLQDTAMPVVEGGLLGSGNPAAMLLGGGLLLNQTMPPAAGTRTTVPAQDINGNPIASPLNPLERFDYHGMPYLINSMEKQKQDDLKAIGKSLGCS